MSPRTPSLPLSPPHTKAGLTLVELLIALFLAIFLIGALFSFYLGQRALYRTNEAIARIQENARFAIELLARELREAGSTPCGARLPIANILDGAVSWWARFATPILGYEGSVTSGFPQPFGTAAAARYQAATSSATPDALILLSATAISDPPLYIIEHNPVAAQFKVSTTNHEIRDGDILLACDSESGALFQVSNASSANVTIVHNTGASVSPGNCTKGLGCARDAFSCGANKNEPCDARAPISGCFVQCTATGNPKNFKATSNTLSYLSRYNASAWYIGCNGRFPCASDPRGRSLYRLRLINRNGTAATTAEEVAEGVTDLQLRYRTATRPELRPADQLAPDEPITAVEISLLLVSPDPTLTPPLQREWTTLIALRNQLP
ncbi:MAG: hypothetical protein N2557_04945 [Hydrogenophilus sp.]|nr:hypothetical protein [Hydrogenophilus sp.]